jgi:2-polyprenyl-3-methyl-5-hydroxy-6-metoxy-1,4-benzoquinol methylase
VVACGRTLGEYLWLVRHADERMDAAVPVNRTERRVFHLDRYRFAGRFAAGRHILDCASGTGYGSGWLARQAAPADVLGIEIDAEAVAYASRHYGTSRAAFTQGDACQLDALEGGSRDLVVSFETIEHVRDDVAMLRGFARVLTDDGILVTSTPNDWPVETSPYHVRSYDPAGFERVLRAWFDEVTLWAHVVPSAQARGGVVPWRGQSTTEAECLVAVCRAPRRA